FLCLWKWSDWILAFWYRFVERFRKRLGQELSRACATRAAHHQPRKEWVDGGIFVGPGKPQHRRRYEWIPDQHQSGRDLRLACEAGLWFDYSHGSERVCGSGQRVSSLLCAQISGRATRRNRVRGRGDI